jgi:hypothetical protein
MSNRRYPPASVRYFKARLLNLTRPAVWGTAMFLSVLGLVGREYAINPNFLRSQPQEQASDAVKKPDSGISPEDKAIAADIDNLPVLLSDSEKAALATANNPVVEAKSRDKRKSSLEEAVNNQKTNATAPPVIVNSDTSGSENPFVTQANDSLKFSNAENRRNGSYRSKRNFNNQSGNQTSTTPNALKTAIEGTNSLPTSNQQSNLGQNPSTNSLPTNNTVNSAPQNNSYQLPTPTNNPTNSTVPGQQSPGFAVPNSSTGSVNNSTYGNSTLPQTTQPQQYNAYPNSQRLPGQ